MIFFFISVLAGILTVLAPCVLPLLPIVIGSSDGEDRRLSIRSIVVIGSLSLSILLFTLLLKATTLLIDIPQTFWNTFSGIIIIAVGLAIIFPSIWSRIPFMQRANVYGNKIIGAGYQKKNYFGDALIGFALGPVFTTCSPTYLFIIATILPAGFAVGLVYLIGFIMGLVVSLLLIAFFGGRLVSKITSRMNATNRIKQIFGVLIILVGIGILTGYDKKLETAILDFGYGATINFEESLINRFAPTADTDSDQSSAIRIPHQLQRAFNGAIWDSIDPKLKLALSGGPGKDGIPSIDTPEFLPINTFRHPDTVQAIVIPDGDRVKVYPYNILNWHEIVNDTAGGVPIAVTFCPLCGSAIVYDRRVDGQVLTFGVSGFLLESNMIMFDRHKESLWQQSTGKILAGGKLDVELDLIPFQLLTIGEVRKLYPNALVLSEDTGHRRDYGTNPYAGYEDSDDYIFSPSQEDARFPSKTIFVVFRYGDEIFGVPYLDINSESRYIIETDQRELEIERFGNQLTIADDSGVSVPFYFEMWFSFIVQHGRDAIVPDLLSASG